MLQCLLRHWSVTQESGQKAEKDVHVAAIFSYFLAPISEMAN